MMDKFPEFLRHNKRWASLVSRAERLGMNLNTVRRIIEGQPVYFSFNISEVCPVDCSCYWRAMGKIKPASDDVIIKFFKERLAQGFVHTTLVGGEPYANSHTLNLLKEVTPIMPQNWLVTSGVRPLINFPKTTHFISVDGADSEVHNKIRRTNGDLFSILRRNMFDARMKYGIEGFPMFLHCVLNAENVHQIEQIYETFLNDPARPDGILFSTMTPINRSIGGDNSDVSIDEHLRLSYEQRVDVVNRLNALKLQDSDLFIHMTKGMINRLHPDYTMHHNPGECNTAKLIPSYRGDLTQIDQCILGPDAVCEECGCVITTITEALKAKNAIHDLETILHMVQQKPRISNRENPAFAIEG